MKDLREAFNNVKTLQALVVELEKVNISGSSDTLAEDISQLQNMLERLYKLITFNVVNDYPLLRSSTRDLLRSFTKELDTRADSDSFGKKHQLQGQLFQIVRIFQTLNYLDYLCLTLMVVKWSGHHSGKSSCSSWIKIKTLLIQTKLLIFALHQRAKMLQIITSQHSG